jgi:hypothetical protein
MKKYFFATIVLLPLLTAACYNKALTNSNKVSSTSAKQSSTSEIKNVIVDQKTDLANLGGTNVNVDSLKIKGDTLSIFVNYGGGCKEHNFELYSNGAYAKSLPPKLTLYLVHTNNNDRCRELIMRELKFNISNIKYTKSLSIKIADKYIMYEPK